MYTKEAKKLLGVSFNTLKSWVSKGRLKYYKLESGSLVWDDTDVFALIGKKLDRDQWIVTYSRVAGTTESDRLVMSQQNLRLLDWCTARGLTPDRSYEDWAPSTEYSLEERPGLHQLLQDVIQNRVSAIVIDSPDRLARFGIEMYTSLFKYYGVEFFILNRVIARPEYLAEQEKDLTRLLKKAGIERLDELAADLKPVPKKPKIKDPGKIVPNWKGQEMPPTSRELSDLM